MIINLTLIDNNFVVDKILCEKIEGESIIILCGQDSYELEEMLIKNGSIVLKLDKTLNIEKQYENKEYIFDLIDFINQEMEFNCPITLLINKQEKKIKDIIKFYCDYIDSIVIISNKIQEDYITHIPLLNVYDNVEKQNNREFKCPTILMKNGSIQNYVKDIINWIKNTYNDNKKLEYPMLKRINSEELSCKMIDLTNSEKNGENQPVKIKII